jgi:signal transduction histidine kinase
VPATTTGGSDPLAGAPAGVGSGGARRGSSRLPQARDGRYGALWWWTWLVGAQLLVAAAAGISVHAVARNSFRDDAHTLAEGVAGEIEERAGVLAGTIGTQVPGRLDCSVAPTTPTGGYVVIRNGEVSCTRAVENYELEGLAFRQGLSFPPSLRGAAAVGVAVDGSLVVGIVPASELAPVQGGGERWVLTGPGLDGGTQAVVPVGADLTGSEPVPVGDGSVTGLVRQVPGSWPAVAVLASLVPLIAAAVLGARVVWPLRRAVRGEEMEAGCAEIHTLVKDIQDGQAALSELALVHEHQGVELRRRLAVELHDGPVQELSTALLVLDLTETSGTDDDIEEIRGCVRTAAEDLRRTCSELLPAPVGRLGVVRSVRAGAEELISGTGIELGIDVDDAAVVDAALRGPMAEVLVRNCLEAVRNSVKHSQASTITVRLWSDGTSVGAEIIDDGIGMDSSDRDLAASRGHVGLASMVELVQLVGGRIEFPEPMEDGSVVRILVPARTMG